MSCGKISHTINSILVKKEIKSNGKQMQISFKTVSNYLKEFYRKPKKERKVFPKVKLIKRKELNFIKYIKNNN